MIERLHFIPRQALGFFAAFIAFLSICHGSAANADEYRVQAGDVLEISVIGISDLKQRMMVPDDGEVFYPLVGQVKVAGLTLAEIRSHLKPILEGRFYQQRTADGREIALPIASDNIVIGIGEYSPVYLNGDVSKPGSYPYRPGLTVRQAVALAGGYDTIRTRMENPYLLAIDLRNQREMLLDQYAWEQARISRIQAELGNEDESADVPEGSRTAVEVRRLELEKLDVRKADFEKQRQHLTEAVRSLNSSLALLEKQTKTEGERAKVDQEDLTRVEGLVAKGMAPVTRLSDTRRLVLLSASRATEIEARAEQVRLRQAEEERKLQKLFDERRIELLKELQDAKLNLAAHLSKLSAVTEKLLVTGAIRSQIGRGSAGKPDLVIFRQSASGAERIAASEETELLPRDVIEVALSIDGDTRGIVPQSPATKGHIGALPLQTRAQ